MILVREINSYSEQVWDDFIVNHQQGTVFHRAQWLAAITATNGSRLIRLGFFEADELVGVLPLIYKGRGLLRVAASPFVVADTPYLGLVISPERMEIALQALDSYLRGSSPGFLRVMQRQNVGCNLPAGMTAIEKTTHILDLSGSEDELWQGLEGRCRTAIRKAMKNGVTVGGVTRPDIIDTYYTMLVDMYARQKMSVPQPKDFYRRIFAAFSGSCLYIMVSEIEGQTVGGIILVRDQDHFYYLDGVSNPQFNNVNPNNLLLWEGVKLAKSLGASYFDFVGSDIPRLAAFKKSFGGYLHYHSCIEKAYLPGFALLRKLYPVFKALRGRFMQREEQ